MSTITAAASHVVETAPKISDALLKEARDLAESVGGTTLATATEPVTTAATHTELAAEAAAKDIVNISSAITGEATALTEPKTKSLFGLFNRKPKAIHLEAWSGVPAEKLVAEKTADNVLTLKEPGGGSIKLTKGDGGDIAAEFTYPDSHKFSSNDKLKQTIVVKDSELPSGIQTKLQDEGFLAKADAATPTTATAATDEAASATAAQKPEEPSSNVEPETSKGEVLSDATTQQRLGDTEIGTEVSKPNLENTEGIHASAH